MAQRADSGLRYFVIRLGGVVLTSGCVILFTGTSYGQSEPRGLSIGVEAIKAMLTGTKQWTFYWDRAHVSRPRLGPKAAERSPSATLEFMRGGFGVIGHAHNDRVHHAECEFDVTVREDGFTFAGCWGSDKTMMYDPADREYPFKGRVDGTLLWLAPS
jgi:hypothetical protein